MARQKFIVEVRDQDGRLDFASEELRRKEHPFLFSKPEFTLDELCHYASFGQGRDNPTGPLTLNGFMAQIGICYREKTWS